MKSNYIEYKANKNSTLKNFGNVEFLVLLMQI